MSELEKVEFEIKVRLFLALMIIVCGLSIDIDEKLDRLRKALESVHHVLNAVNEYHAESVQDVEYLKRITGLLHRIAPQKDWIDTNRAIARVEYESGIIAINYEIMKTTLQCISDIEDKVSIQIQNRFITAEVSLDSISFSGVRSADLNNCKKRLITRKKI